MRKSCLLVLVLIGFTSLCTATESEGEASPQTPSEKLEELFFEWNRIDRPGGSVVVVKDGEIVFRKGYGLSSLELRTENSDGTVYDVASIAEPFTATAIIMLEYEGKLSLDDPVTKHVSGLPEFANAITLKHLLHHTSGLWDWRTVYQACGGYLEDVITWQLILGLVGQQSSPQFNPGTRFEYSPTNYALLAETVQHVTDQSFRDWAWEHIFRPLGMTRSLIRDQRGESIENCAQAYDYARMRGYRSGTANLSLPGAHCLYSSVADMEGWLLQLQSPEEEFAAVVNRLLSPGHLNNGDTLSYGYGLYKDSHNGQTRYRASGQWQGFNSAFHYYPDQSLGIIILCNWVSGWVNPTNQATQIAAIFLEEPASEQEELSTPSTEDSTDFAADPALFAQYLGDYRWEPGDVFAIVQDGDQLYYQYAPGGTLPMTALSNTRFVLTGYDYFFTFQRDDAGHYVQCLIEHEGDEDVVAPMIELVTPSPDELQSFVGDYRCEQLGVLYSLALQEGSLVLTHRRMPDVALSPEAQDNFNARSHAFRMVEFVRNEHGDVTGLKIDTLDMTFGRVN
ncbi:serine hydrolase domain-containing protein [Candidatus Eisenbacteria bacterium]|uniref:Serine hydrolase domain-containing protein n=1 Tax=Eiseniibacteriota bacterium TaxID=2212470 RepID=A0ABV6YJ19_UNCEI